MRLLGRQAQEGAAARPAARSSAPHQLRMHALSQSTARSSRRPDSLTGIGVLKQACCLPATWRRQVNDPQDPTKKLDEYWGPSQQLLGERLQR